MKRRRLEEKMVVGEGTSLTQHDDDDDIDDDEVLGMNSGILRGQS